MNSCATGSFEIHTADGCRAAAAALGKPFSTSKYSSSSYPAGCFSTTSSLLLNEYPGGTTSTSYGKVCETPGTRYSDATSTNVCPYGAAEINSEVDCKTAAAVLGKTFQMTPKNLASYPKGCFSAGASVYVNTHASGGSSSSYGKVCKRGVAATFSDMRSTSTCKPGLYDILTLAGCKAAAVAFGKSFSYTSSSSYPKGCFSYNSNTFYLNYYEYPGSSSSYGKICQTLGENPRRPVAFSLSSSSLPLPICTPSPPASSSVVFCHLFSIRARSQCPPPPLPPPLFFSVFPQTLVIGQLEHSLL